MLAAFENKINGTTGGWVGGRCILALIQTFDLIKNLTRVPGPNYLDQILTTKTQVCDLGLGVWD